ncbi:hypothetical protein H7F33_07615 [Pedobacter sp. PAMC26386]|nr:hypothetical protein H7F33_07615 [Pedobacter sp. PAMC26386]
MNLKSCLFLAFFYAAFAAKAQSNVGFSKKKANNVEIEAYGDYRSSDFQWSIAGNNLGQNPNILSEVKWKNIKGPGMGLDIRLNIWSPIFFKGSYHRTWIKSGQVTDNDYAADNRTEPGYHADLNSNEGFIYTWFVTTGYEFRIGQTLKISPYAGYTKNTQQLHLKNFNNETDPAIKTLNSIYQANRAGLILGAAATLSLTNQLSVEGIVNYSQVKYQAYADWNLIDAFAHPVSFKHKANGYGTEALLQLNYSFTAVLSVLIRGNYDYTNTGKGTDELFLVDGRQLQSQFNGATGSDSGFGIGVSLKL